MESKIIKFYSAEGENQLSDILKQLCQKYNILYEQTTQTFGVAQLLPMFVYKVNGKIEKQIVNCANLFGGEGTDLIQVEWVLDKLKIIDSGKQIEDPRNYPYNADEMPLKMKLSKFLLKRRRNKNKTLP